ncbi:MAG TPA: hypothetical protein VHM66_13050, partial [Solirubrobacterales bacterium]|nr:hypothetical protein [Solirubrobacterales bacterium]
MKKLNLAKVRSAIGATIALVLLLVAAPAAAAKEPPTVELAWLPPGTTVGQLAAAGFSPGLMSAGLGAVPPEQTYLDLTQGNRVFESLYDSPLPPLAGDCPNWWTSVVERAESAPADIVPGLLTSSLAAAGVGVRARGEASCAFSLHRPTDGDSRSAKKSSEAPRPHARAAALGVRSSTLDRLPPLMPTLHGN